MKAYSVDLRERVLMALTRGMPRPEVVRTFGVSLASIKRWLHLQRTGVPLTPKLTSGRRRTIRSEHHVALHAQLAADDDATLEQHTERWNADHGMTICSRTMARAIARIGWTYKKRRWQPPSATNQPGRPTAPASRSIQPSGS